MSVGGIRKQLNNESKFNDFDICKVMNLKKERKSMKRSNILMGALMISAMISSSAFAQKRVVEAKEVARFAEKAGIPKSEVAKLEHEVNLRRGKMPLGRALLASAAMIVPTMYASGAERMSEAAKIVAPEAITAVESKLAVAGMTKSNRMTEACTLGAGAVREASIPTAGGIESRTLVPEVTKSLQRVNEIVAKKGEIAADQADVLDWVLQPDGSGADVAKGIDIYTLKVAEALKNLGESNIMSMSFEQLRDATWTSVEKDMEPAIESTVAEGLARGEINDATKLTVDLMKMPELKDSFKDGQEITVAELKKTMSDEQLFALLVKDGKEQFRRKCHKSFI